MKFIYLALYDDKIGRYRVGKPLFITNASLFYVYNSVDGVEIITFYI